MKKKIIFRLILLAAVLFLFLLSIKLMTGSFKLLGTDFAQQLISFTTNPIAGLFIGILATSIIQSSSVTSSILVGLTASGALTITGAIPILMGANIGTGITGIIVSLGHITRKEEFKKAFEVATVHDLFNIMIVIVLLPLEIYFHVLEKSALLLTQFLLGSNMNISFSSPLNYFTDPTTHFIQNLLSNNPVIIFVLSLAMLFFSLKCFIKLIKPLAKSEFNHLLNKHVFRTPMRSFFTGLFLTALIQSSSVCVSLIVPLAGVGILTIESIFPYILGANIGTTFTALMAAMVTGSPAGVTLALAHVLLNTFGSVMIYPIRKIPIGLSKSLAHLSFRSRIYPVSFVIFAFFILPLIVIFLLH
ncbi:MAG: Na/Pi symporter [Candidatus Diapherotrites archaeon]|nr:Na/Pi symporter [Candidatus Diapherotrites archaeon]